MNGKKGPSVAGTIIGMVVFVSFGAGVIWFLFFESIERDHQNAISQLKSSGDFVQVDGPLEDIGPVGDLMDSVVNLPDQVGRSVNGATIRVVPVKNGWKVESVTLDRRERVESVEFFDTVFPEEHLGEDKKKKNENDNESFE